MISVTPAHLFAIARPSRPQPVYLESFKNTGDRVLAGYGINANVRRLAHFLAQIAHESGRFTILAENLYYSTAAWLAGIFKNHFKDAAAAVPYLRNPQKLGNYVYANRNGNGDVTSGDGFKFRGHGLIQLTGRDNFAALGKLLTIPLEDKPELVYQPSYAVAVAALFWNQKRLKGQHATMNAAADADTSKLVNGEWVIDENALKVITKGINGGYNGLDDRRKLLKRAFEVLS